MRFGIGRLLRLACALVAVLFVHLLGAPALNAQGLPNSPYDERLVKLRVDAIVEPTGDLMVVETITWDFGLNQKRGIFRYVPTKYSVDKSLVKVPDASREYERVVDVDWISVRSSTGAPTDRKITTEAATQLSSPDGNPIKGQVTENSILRIGDPETFITGQHTYEIKYRLKRAVIDGLLQYVAVGEGWTVPIENVDILVTAPIRQGAQVACLRGRADAECTATVTENRIIRVQTSGTGVELEIPLADEITSPEPKLVTPLTLSDAFTPKGVQGAVGGLGLVGAVVGAVLIGRRGVDRVYAHGGAIGSTGDQERRRKFREKLAAPVEFEPPEGIRPGLIGPAREGEALPNAISVMVVDLAARGVIRIEPTDQQGSDYILRYQGTGREQLSENEVHLMNALFGRGGTEAQLSELEDDIHLAGQIRMIRKGLEQEAVDHKWWDSHPIFERRKWRTGGILLIFAGGFVCFLLSAFKLGLLGLAPIVLGIGMLIVAQSMPVRTAKGSRIEARLRGFELLFDAGEGDRLKLAERTNLFAEYLPYAMAFGNVDKWVQTFAKLGVEPNVPYFGPAGYGGGMWWGGGYYGSGGGGLDRVLQSFDQSFNHSIEAGAAAERARQAAASRAASSSSGGGFSGGSFGGGGSSGGGGGGSW
jgi:hypothetical protein